MTKQSKIEMKIVELGAAPNSTTFDACPNTRVIMGMAMQVTVPALIKTIRAHLDKAHHCEAKSEQHYISAGLHLTELKARYKHDVKGMQTWAEFVREKFDLGQARADELIRIADGRTTIAETRTNTAARVQKHAKAKKSVLANIDNEPSAKSSQPIISALEVDNTVLTNAATPGVQMQALTLELKQFYDDYSARVKRWAKTCPDRQFIAVEARLLEQVSSQLRRLAQEIEGNGTAPAASKDLEAAQ